jgi:prepilin-type N-terminal cleavage/methylation domain-containing protein
MHISGAIFKMMPSNLNKRNHGFTLVELLVAMTLGLVVLAAILNMFASQNRTSAVQQEVAYAQQNMRAAMDLIVREIRNAGYDPEDNGFDAIQTATSDSIRVLSNITGDDETGNPDDANEDVTYTIDNANHELERDGTVMIKDVVPNSLQFTYYRPNGTAFVPADQNDRDDIRMVAIQFQVHTENEDPGYSGGYDLYPSNAGTCRVRTIATRVRIRNMGFQDI